MFKQRFGEKNWYARSWNIEVRFRMGPKLLVCCFAHRVSTGVILLLRISISRSAPRDLHRQAAHFIFESSILIRLGDYHNLFLFYFFFLFFIFIIFFFFFFFFFVMIHLQVGDSRGPKCCEPQQKLRVPVKLLKPPPPPPPPHTLFFIYITDRFPRRNFCSGSDCFIFWR